MPKMRKLIGFLTFYTLTFIFIYVFCENVQFSLIKPFYAIGAAVFSPMTKKS